MMIKGRGICNDSYWLIANCFCQEGGERKFSNLTLSWWPANVVSVSDHFMTFRSKGLMQIIFFLIFWKYTSHKCLNSDTAILFNSLWWRSLSYRNQSINSQSNSMDWFLYNRELHHERVKDCPVKPLYLGSVRERFSLIEICFTKRFTY